MAAHEKVARRSVFKAMGLMGVAGIVAKTSGKAVTVDLLVGQDLRSDRYRLTEHIQKYYRSTLI